MSDFDDVVTKEPKSDSQDSDQGKAILSALKKAGHTKKTAATRKPLAQETSVFYSHNIRRLYYQDHWYFFLEDILMVAGIVNWQKQLEELEEMAEFQKNKDKHLFKFKALVEKTNEVEEEIEEVKEVWCVDYQGFMWLLPMIRSEKHIFPGPFPEWLAEISKLPLSLPENKQTN